MISDEEYAREVMNYRYRVRKTIYQEAGSVRSLSIIALIDCRTKLICQVSDYADYLIYRNNRDMSYKTSNTPGLHAVCQFLNYVLIENYVKYRIRAIEDVTLQMFKDFLEDYAHSETKQGGRPSKESVLTKRNNISTFLAMLCHYKKSQMRFLREDELIGTKYVIRSNAYSKIETVDYKVKVRYAEAHKTDNKLLRDMPLEIVERFVKMALIYDPEFVFAIVLMAFAGLREGEVCNVRRLDSCFGPGLLISYNDEYNEIDGEYKRSEEFNSVIIDLTDTLVMRGDGVLVGEIKRERKQAVHSSYTPIISEYYHKHMRLISKKSCEEYGPIFLNKYKTSKTGKYMAMTISSLRRRITSLFRTHVLPSCEKDLNPKFRMFYARMQNHSWGPHAFRYWFTVSLVLMGCDEVTIQTLRGDRSPESSRHYLERKGELQRIYHQAVEILGIQIRATETEEVEFFEEGRKHEGGQNSNERSKK